MKAGTTLVEDGLMQILLVLFFPARTFSKVLLVIQLGLLQPSEVTTRCEGCLWLPDAP